MHSLRSRTRMVGLLVGAAAIMAVLIFVLQLSSISVMKLIHGDRIVGSGQFWLLELLAGGITSFIVTGIALLLFRRLIIWVSALSIAMQFAWMAFTLEFATPANSIAEFAFRSAESAGIILGVALAVLVVRGLFLDKRADQA